jgi:hypothetical protein
MGQNEPPFTESGGTRLFMFLLPIGRSCGGFSGRADELKKKLRVNR